MDHYADGKVCGCKQAPSSMGIAEYAEAHPNKKGPNGETFNDSIDDARRIATTQTPAR